VPRRSDGTRDSSRKSNFARDEITNSVDSTRESKDPQRIRIFSSPRGGAFRIDGDQPRETQCRERRERRDKKEVGKKALEPVLPDTSTRCCGRLEKFHLTVDQLSLARGSRSPPLPAPPPSIPRSSSRASWHLFGHANRDKAQMRYNTPCATNSQCARKSNHVLLQFAIRSHLSRGATRKEAITNSVFIFTRERERERKRGRGRTAI